MTTSAKNHAETLVQSGHVPSKSQLMMESSTFGINDAYMFIAILAIVAFFVTMFMPKEW
jgi:hypothetical protein